MYETSFQAITQVEDKTSLINHREQEIHVSKAPELDNRAPEETELITKLLARLDEEQIRYCHWKSNWRIEDWLTGEGDLDLLVRREDVTRFIAVLSRLGFKKTLAPEGKELPGVINYYGFDTPSQRLIHVHAHYQLVLGHDATKNYRLPIELPLLETAARRGPIFVTAPEVELAIFVVRMVLKFSAAEFLARRLAGKLDALLAALQNERLYLESQVDAVKFNAVLEKLFPTIDRALFNDCLDSLRPQATIWQRLRAKRRLEKSLISQARQPRLAELIWRWERTALAVGQKYLLRRVPRKRFESGGLLVAVVGGDGSGKSTCVKGLHKWLAKRFETRSIHFGNPPKALATWLVIAAVRGRRWLVRQWSLRVRNETPPEFDTFRPEVNFLQQLRWLCTARDRYRLYCRVRRLATNGGIAICDRYPVKNVQLMDGPRIERSLGGEPATGLVRHLIELERWYYRQIMDPDLLFVLRVEPETAVRRKTTEPAEHVRPRAEELWRLDWQGTQARLIDTGRPLTEVLADLRSAIWTAL